MRKVVEANIAKEMEAEFKLLLQDRFDESKEVEKALLHHFWSKNGSFSESTT